MALMTGRHAKVLLGMTLALLPTVVLAQQVLPRFEVTPFAGYRIGETFVDSDTSMFCVSSRGATCLIQSDTDVLWQWEMTAGASWRF